MLATVVTAAATVVTAAATLERITLAAPSNGVPLTFLDESGRSRLFHGTNALVKGPPWHPDPETFSPDVSMAEHDFEVMQSLGLNVLRLGIMWPGVEPSAGSYNETYLDQIDKVVTLAAEHGIYTLLDMHQDGLSEYYCGEGLPSWAVRHTAAWDGRRLLGKAFPAPFDRLDPPTDYYNESRLGNARIPTRQACDAHNAGPGHSEMTEEAANSYQALYANVDGIGQAWADMWAHVAARFEGRHEILGLELLNEPFAGDVYADPLLLVPHPNPHNADALNLQPAYDRIVAAVRAVDKEALVFFAGVTWADLGVGFTAPPGGDANRSVVSYHFYTPPQGNVPLQFTKQAAAAVRLQTAAFLTETSQPGSGTAGVDFMRPGGIGDGADAALQSWAGYEWKAFCREEAGVPVTHVSQLGAWGACKTGYSRGNWDGRQLNATVQEASARTYARAVAGVTTRMYFNVSSGDFELQYAAKDAGGAPTEIFAWRPRYPGGALVTATASAGTMRVEYDAAGGSSLVHVYAGTDVAEGVRVVVNIRRRERRVERRNATPSVSLPPPPTAP